MLRSGDVFDRYRIVEPLGRGGMAEVYRAFDTRLRREVALKLIRPDGAADAAVRVTNEARAAAVLNHPHAASIYDVGDSGGTPYIVMELVRGQTLQAFLRDATISLPIRLRWLGEIARALGAAHTGGLVHRDLKPSNVMIAPGGSVKVLDFGLAKGNVDAVGAAAGAFGHATQVLGSARYIAPEQLTQQRLDGRVDQFAWGVLGYELLTGMHPFPGASGTSEFVRPPPISAFVQGVSTRVADTIMRAMSLSPQARFPTMDDVLAQLEQSGPETLPAPAESEGRPSMTAYLPTPMGSGRTVAIFFGVAHALVMVGVLLAAFRRGPVESAESPALKAAAAAVTTEPAAAHVPVADTANGAPIPAPPSTGREPTPVPTGTAAIDAIPLVAATPSAAAAAPAPVAPTPAPVAPAPAAPPQPVVAAARPPQAPRSPSPVVAAGSPAAAPAAPPKPAPPKKPSAAPDFGY